MRRGLDGRTKLPKHFLMEPTAIFYYSADLFATVSMTATF